MRLTMSRSTAVLLAVAIAFLATVALVVWIDRANGVNYTLTFREARGLQSGAPVVLDGVKIGHVTRVDVVEGGVAVGLHLFPDHAGAVHAPPNTTGRIHEGTPIIGSPYVEILNRAEPGEGIASGARVEGLEGLADELAWTGKEKVAASWDRLVALTKGEIRQLELWLDTRDTGAIKDNVTTFMTDFEAAAAEKAGTARESMAALFTRARELGGEMRRSPEAREAADDVERALETVLENSQELSAEARARLEEVLGELRASAAEPGTEPGS